MQVGHDDTIGWIRDRWKDFPEVLDLATKMEALGRNMAVLRRSDDPESRRKARLVWQKAASIYWDLVWAIVEAKIEADPPERMRFDEPERLFIDFGHMNSKYTTPNEYFAEQLAAPTAVDMYQYNRLTDYICENYALIFGKEFDGPQGGVSLQDKLAGFAAEMKACATRRRMASKALFSSLTLIGADELDALLKKLEDGLTDAVETEMRTKRVREAQSSERDRIRDNARLYESAERDFLALIDTALSKLCGEEPDDVPEPESPAAATQAPQEKKEEEFDPFADLEALERRAGRSPAPKAEVLPEEAEQAAEPYEGEDLACEDAAEEEEQKVRADQAIDHSVKIVQNLLALHDRAKFLTGLIVHVAAEEERWKTRTTAAKNKYKGQGLPALKMELRTALNHKKEFMALAARTGRVDSSPLCASSHKPISAKRAGEIMMELTPLDPGMLRAARIRMYGIPRVILVPGAGLGVYDWEDNSLVIPIFPVFSDVKDFCYALAGFRWDNDEDRTLKDSYALLKSNKGKGIRALQESFAGDYFLWISKERKGYRILPREVSKWFKAFLKTGTGENNAPKRTHN